MFLAKKIDLSLVLWKTDDLQDTLVRKLATLRKGKVAKRLFVRAFDVKEFYTNLAHVEICKAILWLFGKIRESFRREL